MLTLSFHFIMDHRTKYRFSHWYWQMWTVAIVWTRPIHIWINGFVYFECFDGACNGGWWFWKGFPTFLKPYAAFWVVVSMIQVWWDSIDHKLPTYIGKFKIKSNPFIAIQFIHTKLGVNPTPYIFGLVLTMCSVLTMQSTVRWCEEPDYKYVHLCWDDVTQKRYHEFFFLSLSFSHHVPTLYWRILMK